MSKTAQNTANVSQLFQTAKEERLLSPAAAQILSVKDLGAEIQAALGVHVDDVKASEVVLVTMLIDDSGSIRFAGNAELVREGHNLILDALKESKQDDSVLVHTRYLNGTILYPYAALPQTVKMDTHNYDPSLGTPLYDETVVILGTVLAKAQEFSSNGVPVRTVTCIITDGADEHSPRNRGGRGTTPQNCAVVIKDMLSTENHIIAAMGIDDGGRTDFRQVFKEMGIREEWILTPANTKTEVRRAFQVVSKSMVRASQSAANFSKTALGGFGAP